MSDDYVGKMFSMMFAIAVMFILPVILIAGGTDITQRSYVNNQLQIFASEVRSTGFPR